MSDETKLPSNITNCVFAIKRGTPAMFECATDADGNYRKDGSLFVNMDNLLICSREFVDEETMRRITEKYQADYWQNLGGKKYQVDYSRYEPPVVENSHDA